MQCITGFIMFACSATPVSLCLHAVHPLFHYVCMLCTPCFIMLITTPHPHYRPSPALRTALDTMMTTHHTSMALDDLHTYLTWCIAVAHRAPTPILETASSRLLHRLMAHPTRPAPPTTSAPCYVAHQARWLHAQYVAGIRNPERRAQRRWAAYPTKVCCGCAWV